VTFKSSTVKAADSLLFSGITSRVLKSPVTNDEYIEWLGKPMKQKIVNYKATEPIDFIVPKGIGFQLPVMLS
jgi:hypothetical protein